jgi:hypothetical protein
MRPAMAARRNRPPMSMSVAFRNLNMSRHWLAWTTRCRRCASVRPQAGRWRWPVPWREGEREKPQHQRRTRGLSGGQPAQRPRLGPVATDRHRAFTATLTGRDVADQKAETSAARVGGVPGSVMPNLASPTDSPPETYIRSDTSRPGLRLGVGRGVPEPPSFETISREYFRHHDTAQLALTAAGNGPWSRAAEVELGRRRRAVELARKLEPDGPEAVPPAAATARERLGILVGFGLDVADFLIVLRVGRAAAASPVSVRSSTDPAPTVSSSPQNASRTQLRRSTR